ncbi:MAG: glycoside hydrolase family 3 C-terminal domain-containing protein, partial [Saprospiraceae bacterium]
GATYDQQKHHDFARQVAGECAVLLKNDGAILPLGPQLKKVAVIGLFAKSPRYQGAGSSQIRTTQLSNAFDEWKKVAGKTQLGYAAGYSPEGVTTEQQIAEAIQLAKTSEVAVVFAGLPDTYESEGFDRKNMDLPEGQNRLIAAVAKANPNTVVVVMNGSAVAMPWIKGVKGVLEGWLGGQAGGGALVDILTGKVNPSGKLSETFPMQLADSPTALDFPATDGDALYGEGIYIGYRYYDKKNVAPLFPFGFGLSYTRFSYSNLKINGSAFKDSDEVTGEFTVKNTGKLAGQEIAELYVHDHSTTVSRPENELKYFAKVALQPGEQKTVSFRLGYRDFAFYDPHVQDWKVSTGQYDLRVGGSSRQLPLSKTLDMQATRVFTPVLTRYSLMKEFKNHPKGQAIYQQIMGGMVPPGVDPNSEEAKKMQAMMELFLGDMPIQKMVAMSEGKMTDEMLDGILIMVNK